MPQNVSNSASIKDNMLEKVDKDSDDIIDVEIMYESIFNMKHDFLIVNKSDWRIDENGTLIHDGKIL